MKILITGGGSEEKIDNVRSICNFSTGRTSSFLSTFFVEKGFSVSLITSHRSVMPENKNVNVYKYESFSELKNLLEMECKTSSTYLAGTTKAATKKRLSSSRNLSTTKQINRISCKS